MADRSLVYLVAVTAFYSLSSAVTSIFLPNYYLQIGLSINQIILLNASMFLTLGIVPILMLKFFNKGFEKLLAVGIILNIIFYIMLISVKNPLVLGLTEGLSFATFWPAFNLLLFRLTSIKKRGMTVSLLYVVIPTVTGIVGPSIGGFFINFFAFGNLFIVGIALLTFAFLFSLKINYVPADKGFKIPRNSLMLLFALIITVYGFSETSFITYPLFLHQLTGGFLEMGLLASVLSAIFIAVSLIAGRISQMEKQRINFVLIGMLMSSIWLFAIAFVQNALQLIGISMISGIAGAFNLLLFCIYGDFFKRKQHATLVVLWEVFLMFGRLGNLLPVDVFINNFDFRDYFLTVGIISLCSILLLLILKSLYSKNRIRVDNKQM